MSEFFSVVESKGISLKAECFSRDALFTLQVNMGNLCNQHCRHCYADGSSRGEEVMSLEVIYSILKFLARNKGLVLDVTGGSPELNPHFNYFIKNAKELVKKIIVRSNLTVLTLPERTYLPERNSLPIAWGKLNANQKSWHPKSSP